MPFTILLSPRTPSYNQQIRLTAIKYIQRLKCPQTIDKLKNSLFDKNSEMHRSRYFNHSIHHSVKLRYMQAVAILCQQVPTWNDHLLNGILNEINQTNVTYINEMIIAHTVEPNQIIELIDKVSQPF